ncbi:Putative cell wall-binding protein [Pedococcus cremeus]|uniref:Putative cell wall-binding protein n=1 Tax=Pedococcus cremeus TaxID=587636 RepID=A0A1H9X9P4_9MICO|nr:cell wall-binding repeat-containing protein [Pedococcus cremeus]SES42880.1 Putative cell wall-binding protein [Pedococcus cremeus]
MRRPASLIAAALVAGALAVQAVAASAATTSRLAGPDRYATAVAISKKHFAGPVDRVVVASGQDFPDALGAGPFAAHFGVPLLLVPKDGSLPSSVATELSRLKPSSIEVVGGTGAVSDDMLAQLDDRVPSPGRAWRWSGGDRYETAARLAYGAEPGSTVFVASGTGFADALGGGAAAAHLNGALVLTKPTQLPPSVTTVLQSVKPAQVVVLGGTGAVSSAVERQIRAAVPTANVSRSAGADRYATAAAVSRATFPSATTVYLAAGSSFPDALAGAPAAGSVGAPLLLTAKSCAPAATRAEITRLGATRIVALGGTGVVSDAALALKPC